MTEITGKENFTEKYQDADRIWSGKSFLDYLELMRTLLAELPISAAAVASKAYGRKFPGNLDYVYGEIMYSLTGYEGYLHDKAFPIMDCFIRPIFKPQSVSLEFDIRYQTNQGEEVTRSAEVVRQGKSSYIFFTDYHRPL